jgi:hypothetical protein
MRRLLAALVLVLILTGCDNKAVVPAAGRPSPSREGETWGPDELIAFLEARGIHVEVVRRPVFTRTGTIRVERRYLLDVHVEESPRHAREYADDRGQRGYSWGKFCFVGDKSAIRIVRHALES